MEKNNFYLLLLVFFLNIAFYSSSQFSNELEAAAGITPENNKPVPSPFQNNELDKQLKQTQVSPPKTLEDLAQERGLKWLEKDMQLNTKNDQVKSYTYDAKATNFERFKNSPCYDKIGFDPTSDMTSLEQQYSECENKQITKIILKSIYILIFFILLGVVFFFSLSKEKRTQLISKIIKIT
jgi:cell division protein FtsL